MNTWLLVALAALSILAIPLAVAIQRSTELFVVAIAEGRLRLVRGRLPQSLFADLSDVVERARVRHGRIRVAMERGSPRVGVTGDASDPVVQQIRNVVGRYPVARLRNGNMRR